MKITVSIYNNEQLHKWKKYIQAAILNHKDFSLVYEDLELSSAIKTCIENHIEPILAVNKMIYQDDLKSIEELLLKYKEYTFLVTDLGVYNLAKKHHLENHIIYDPQTMITNHLELKEFSSLGFKGISMSLEIPFQDVLNSICNTDISLFYQVFGHRLMFYSKRKLISLYEQHGNLNIIKEKLYLKEQTRNDLFPVIENTNGTMIYRSYLISLLSYTSDISSFGYVYLESLYIDNDIFLQVLSLYFDALVLKKDLNELLEEQKTLNLDIQEGFAIQDSIYQKELF